MDSLPGFVIRLPCYRLSIELHSKDRRLRGCSVTFWGWLVPAVPIGCPVARLDLLDDPNIVFLIHRMRIFRSSEPLFAELEWDSSGQGYWHMGSPLLPVSEKSAANQRRAVNRVFGWILAFGLAPLGRGEGSCDINSAEQLADRTRAKIINRIIHHEDINQSVVADDLNLSESRFKGKLAQFHLSWKTLRHEAYTLTTQASKKY